MPIQQIYSLICDDIRFEQKNKLSYIGVYSDGILVPKLPFTFPRFCVAQEYESDRGEQFNIRARLRGPKLNLPTIEGIRSPRSSDSNRVKLPLIISPLVVEEEGDYFFEVYIEGSKEPNFVTKFYVRLMPKSEKKADSDISERGQESL